MFVQAVNNNADAQSRLSVLRSSTKSTKMHMCLLSDAWSSIWWYSKTYRCITAILKKTENWVSVPIIALMKVKSNAFYNTFDLH